MGEQAKDSTARAREERLKRCAREGREIAQRLKRESVTALASPAFDPRAFAEEVGVRLTRLPLEEPGVVAVANWSSFSTEIVLSSELSREEEASLIALCLGFFSYISLSSSPRILKWSQVVTRDFAFDRSRSLEVFAEAFVEELRRRE